MDTFQFSDPNKTPFVVGEFRTNGPAAPSSPLPLHSQAVNANTTLLLVGKGVVEYSELVQSNLLYLLENFANATEPAYAIEGQLWYQNTTGRLNVYNGIDWLSLVVNGLLDIPLDVNNQRIINLADPVDPTDATNKQYVDDTFVMLAGSIMTGFLTLSADPVDPLHASTKQYVDDEIAAAVLASGGSSNAYTDAQVALKVSKAGDTMTGPLVMDTTFIQVSTGSILLSNSSLLLTGLSIVDFDDNRLSSVGTPVDPTDATNKQYVDDAVSDVTITDATIDTMTGIVSLQTGAGPLPLTSAPLASFVHRHYVPEIDYLLFGPTTNRSFIVDAFVAATFPLPSIIDLEFTLNSINSTIRKLILKTERHIEAGSGTTTMTLPFNYPVHMDKLSVYEDGVKMYRNNRGQAVLSFPTPIEILQETTLAPGFYYFDLEVDGVTYINQEVDLSNVQTPFAYYYDVIRAMSVGMTDQAYIDINLSAPPTGATSTGLLAGTTYEATIEIDGELRTLSILGDNALTYDGLISELQTASSFTLQAAIVASALRLYSASRGDESLIENIVDAAGPTPAPLFSSLTLFTSIAADVPGVTRASIKYENGAFILLSSTVDVTSDVQVSAPTAGTDLLAALSATSLSTLGTSVYAYNETGLPMRYSNTVEFSVATNPAAVYEFIVEPYGLVTNNSGVYI